MSQDTQTSPPDTLVQVAGAKNPDGSFALPDAVRVKCKYCGGIGHHKFPGRSGIWCTNCQRRGWNGSQDLATWLEACTVLGKTRIDLLYLEKWYVALEHGGDSYSGASILEALVSALARALVAQGDKLMEEAKQWPAKTP